MSTPRGIEEYVPFLGDLHFQMRNVPEGGPGSAHRRAESGCGLGGIRDVPGASKLHIASCFARVRHQLQSTVELEVYI